MKATNPEFLPSNCRSCKKMDGDLCKLWPRHPERWEHIAKASKRTRCQFYEEVRR